MAPKKTKIINASPDLIPLNLPVSRYVVDISEILESLAYLDKLPYSFLYSVQEEIVNIGRMTLLEVFEEAMATQDPDAFEEEFRDHVRGVVGAAKFDRALLNDTLLVKFDFEQLGSVEDLKRAFHQGARLKGGGVVDGPYSDGMELENAAESRHIFWLAVRQGATSVPAGRRRGIHGHFVKGGKIPIPVNAWAETKAKYIEIWGDKAPEWLYLQYGQERWDPYIRPTSIIEDFTAHFYHQADRHLRMRLDEEIAYVNKLRTFKQPFLHDAYKRKPSGGYYYNVRNAKGRFQKLS